ncbi:MAG: tyrosine--tRNA ligase, partial [Gammaproteobacteria bacterium]
NLLVGRQLQQAYGQPPQVVLTMPLLEGLDGVQKMSKSLGNYVGITEPPGEMFGKLMSISDDLMWRYFELLSFRPAAEIGSLKREVGEGRNPRDVKFELALEIVARFHDDDAARRAQQEFIARFQKGKLPSEIPETRISAGQGGALIGEVLTAAGLSASNSEAFRMIKQGAVRVDDQRVEDRALQLKAGRDYVVQVGKRRIARVWID